MNVIKQETSIFNFENSNIRVIVIDDEPWFVGKDVAEVLGYKDTTNAMKLHCRGVAKHHPIIDSLGRTQETRIINRPDMLRLIVCSQLPSAIKFEAVDTSFFEELSSTQEPLGYEFEQVLFENLWDLYQS